MTLSAAEKKSTKKEQTLFKKTAQMVSMKKSMENKIQKQYQASTRGLKVTQNHLVLARRRLEEAEKLLARRQAKASAEEHGLKVLASRVSAVMERMRNQT